MPSTGTPPNTKSDADQHASAAASHHRKTHRSAERGARNMTNTCLRVLLYIPRTGTGFGSVAARRLVFDLLFLWSG